MIQKVHRSAICLIPPTEVWQRIQGIRSIHDKSYVRWMPHMNVLYPFHVDEADNLRSAATRAAMALSGVPPFKVSHFNPLKSIVSFIIWERRTDMRRVLTPMQVSLHEFAYFQHRRSCTLWLSPDPFDKIQTLASALFDAFPDCTDLKSDPKRGIAAYTPHLSVGQWPSLEGVAAARDHLSSGWQPIEFELGWVGIISRQGQDSPFTLRFKVPLGGGGPHELNSAYIAGQGSMKGWD